MESLSEIAPILIALCALALSIQQGCASRKQSKEDAQDGARSREHEKTLFEETQRQNRLSCQPHLTSHSYADSREDGVYMSYSVNNHGLGPAFIKDVQLFLDEQPFELGRAPIKAIANAVFGNLEGFDVKKHSWMKPGYAFPEKAAYSYGLFFFKGMSEETYAETEDAFERMQIRIEYESIYGERFVFNSRED